MEQLLPIAAEYGIGGLIVAYLLWMLAKRDERINTLTDQLVGKSDGDAERFTKITLTMERILMEISK